MRFFLARGSRVKNKLKENETRNILCSLSIKKRKSKKRKSKEIFLFKINSFCSLCIHGSIFINKLAVLFQEELKRKKNKEQVQVRERHKV
jgi:hypothetical protein